MIPKRPYVVIVEKPGSHIAKAFATQDEVANYRERQDHEARTSVSFKLDDDASIKLNP